MKSIAQASFLFAAICFLAAPRSKVHAQVFPPDFFAFPVAKGFAEPTSIAFLKDDYLLVSEKGGKIKRIRTGENEIDDFFEGETETSGERGLQSIVTHPEFPNIPYVFIYYTEKDGTRNRLSRVKVLPDYTPGNEEILLEFDFLKDALYHNGGGLSISNDKIYLAIGDQFDLSASQDFDRFSGKLLRLNLDGTIPDDSPQKEGSLARKSIWSYGLRNPFTIDIDGVTGKMFVNDVGYGSWEEINDTTSPLLYFGWPYGEGDIAHYNVSIPFVDPIFKYANNISDPDSPLESWACAITLGTFYRTSKSIFPNHYIEKYFFSDICNGWIGILDQQTLTTELFATGLIHGTIGLKTSPDGSLYYLNFVEGTLNKIIYERSEAPRFLHRINDAVSSIGDNIEVNAYFSGRGAPKLRWLKDGETIQDGVSSKLLLSDLSESSAGFYRAVVYNEHGSDSSNIFKVVVREYNSQPCSEIVLRSPGKLYTAGDTIFFLGNATDLEDGSIDQSNFRWMLQFHHEIHFHPGPEIVVRPDYNYFVVPRIGEISTNVWFKIILVLEDSNGATATTFVGIYPRIITIDVISKPENIDFLLDGKPFTAPYSFASVAGGIRELAAAPYVNINGNEFIRTSPSISNYKFAPEGDSVILLEYHSPETSVGMFPNPADTFFTLNVASSVPQKIRVKVFSTTGILCFEVLFEAKGGANSFAIDTTNLKQGLYKYFN